MSRIFALATLIVFASGLSAPAGQRPPEKAGRYAVIVSQATRADPAWGEVVDALAKKHHAAVVTYNASLGEALPALRAAMPRYVGLVATPAEATRDYVAQVHRLMRKLDDDPYTDALWGIVTGYDAANALRMVKETEPLVVRRVLSATEIALELCEEGTCYSELRQNHVVRKARGQAPKADKAPDDTTEELVRELNDRKPDLLVTSGHATERDWQIGFRYRGGQFRSKAGKLFGVDTRGRQLPIDSPNPKVYLPVGNCLIGHVDGPDAMALALMNSAGVRQMTGYVVPTWYGYMGWGCLDYFLEQPGRCTLAEAFFANNQALIHRETRQPGPSAADARGLAFDRDVVAFYGDPAWPARMAPGPCAWEQRLERRGEEYRFEIIPKRGEKSFEPVNTNGSQRGGRPVFQFLPGRVKDVKILEGADLQPVVTDNFLLVPLPARCEAGRVYRVVFRATLE